MSAPSTGDPATGDPVSQTATTTAFGSATPPLREGASSAALVLGVVAVGVAVFPLLFWAGWVLGSVAVVVGVVALRRVHAGRSTGRGPAIAGMALGVAAVPLGVVGMLVVQAAYTGRAAA